MLIAGVDEAGRGPCFGPMTLSIVVMEKGAEEELREEGVRDSKELLPNKRKKLEKIVKKKSAEHKTIVLKPIEINDLMVRYSLNEIEAMQIGKMINSLKHKPEIIFIDSPDTVEGSFEARIRRYTGKKIKITAENKADSKYVVVGAASILAKVKRDNEIEKLSKKFGDIGSGYPADPKTQKYLNEYVEKHKKLPPFSRIFWKNCEAALKKAHQKKLF
ncbi:MAG: ribonuclease HII [Candidatus Diapherotrites archaeon]|nr:ribonuclease HII [Candidatus Diapherotrites archaeon]